MHRLVNGRVVSTLLSSSLASERKVVERGGTACFLWFPPWDAVPRGAKRVLCVRQRPAVQTSFPPKAPGGPENGRIHGEALGRASVISPGMCSQTPSVDAIVFFGVGRPKRPFRRRGEGAGGSQCHFWGRGADRRRVTKDQTGIKIDTSPRPIGKLSCHVPRAELGFVRVPHCLFFFLNPRWLKPRGLGRW